MAAVATAVVSLSTLLATTAVLPLGRTQVPTRCLVWFLVFLACLMAGGPAAEPFLRRAARRRARARGEG
ncbi:hypothetical protein ACWGB8_02700 [Kitasatospora sp. NPDC054939]